MAVRSNGRRIPCKDWLRECSAGCTNCRISCCWFWTPSRPRGCRKAGSDEFFLSRSLLATIWGDLDSKRLLRGEIHPMKAAKVARLRGGKGKKNATPRLRKPATNIFKRLAQLE